MKRSGYLITTLLVVLVVFAITGFLVIQRNGRCARIQCVSFVNKERYSLSDTYEDSSDAFRAMFKSGDTMLRVEVRSHLSISDAQTLMDGFIAQIKGLYENVRSPYPGDVSNEIVCAKEYIPQFATTDISGVRITHFSSYLTRRLTNGACAADLTPYQAVTATFYCPEARQLMIFEWIAPKQRRATLLTDEKSLIQSIRCKGN